MMQTKIRNLCDRLAEAFGLTSRAINYIVGDLQRAEMIGAMDELARIEDAGRLVVAVAGDFDVRAPRRVIERFWSLPLAGVRLGTEEPDHVEMFAMCDEDKLVATVRAVMGGTLGTALCNLIGDFTFGVEFAPVPGDIHLSGALGRTSGKLHFGQPERFTVLEFDQPAFPSATSPHGLPIAGPMRTTVIDAGIFEVLRTALADSPHSWANAAEGRADVYSFRSLEGS